MFENIKIYIVHYKKLVDRKKNLLSYFSEFPFPYKFFDEIDRDTLTLEQKRKFTDKKDDTYKANFLTHIKCYREILSNDNKFHLILEDDSIPQNNFSKLYLKYLKQLPEDFDMFFISPGKNNFHLPLYKRRPFKTVYRKYNKITSWGGHGASRCADAYFISRKCCEKLITEFDNKETKVDTSIDWWMNEMITKYDLKVYWAEPTIVNTDLYETSIN